MQGAAPPQSGGRLGRYELHGAIARGGMATVYLATQESVQRDVALKIMSPTLHADPDFGERFLREARIAAKLHHRHVVGVHDVGRIADHHYIAMEFLGGGTVLSEDGSAEVKIGRFIVQQQYAYRLLRCTGHRVHNA